MESLTAYKVFIEDLQKIIGEMLPFSWRLNKNTSTIKPNLQR